LKILGIIPARGGSKGVPRKNIKLLNGKPLIVYTIEEAKKSKLTELIVSTDDVEIIDISKKNGATVPFKRPEFLGSDTTPTIDVIKHVLIEFEKAGISFDAICILQVTTPFRDFNLINECIDKFDKDKFDSVVSVREVPSHYNPHWVFELNEKGFLQISTGEKQLISRRQDLPKAYFRDGSVYITTVQNVLNNSSLYGEKIGFVVNDSQRYINIDTLDDWKQAVNICKNDFK